MSLNEYASLSTNAKIELHLNAIGHTVDNNLDVLGIMVSAHIDQQSRLIEYLVNTYHERYC